MNFRKKFFKFVLGVGDVVLMYSSILLALAIRFHDFSFLPGHETRAYLFYFSFIHLIWLLILFFLDFYEIPPLKDIFEFFSHLAIFIVSALITSAVYFYFQPVVIITPKTILFLDVLILGTGLFLWRVFFVLVLKMVNFKERIMVIGAKPELKDITPEVLERNRYSLIAYKTGETLDYSFLKKKINERAPHSIVLALDAYKEKEAIKEIFSLLPLGLNYISFKAFYEKSLRKVPLDSVDEGWFLENLRRRGKIHKFLKRSFDIMFSLVGLSITVVIFPVVALFIKITSPGHVFFKQKRVGKDGRIFELYKFRTMKPEVEKEHPSWEVEKDSRLIPFGEFLRGSHLDEFPQFYNILRGDISFVGPRPEWLEFVKVYRENIPFYNIRHMITPGLTGWAQLKHHNGAAIEEVRNKLKYDLYYIKHHAFIFDLGIIFKTVSNITGETCKKMVRMLGELKNAVSYKFGGRISAGSLVRERREKENVDVLVADDEEIVRELLGKFLRRKGYSPLFASNGHDAVSIVENNNVCAAIVDIRMAGAMDGWEVLKRIKKIKNELGVIIITGFGTEKTRKLSSRLGAYAYIEKPLDLPDIKRQVEGILNARLPAAAGMSTDKKGGELVWSR